MTSMAGTENELTLTFTANLPFEAAAFDDIEIQGAPEPSSFALLGLDTMVALGISYRRRRARSAAD
jgi:hypothetical protein